MKCRKEICQSKRLQSWGLNYIVEINFPRNTRCVIFTSNNNIYGLTSTPFNKLLSSLYDRTERLVLWEWSHSHGCDVASFMRTYLQALSARLPAWAHLPEVCPGPPRARRPTPKAGPTWSDLTLPQPHTAPG